MPAAKLTLPPIEKGATYRHTLYWKDKNGTAINLTGCTAKMQVRESTDSTTVLLELSSDNSRILFTAIDGKIELYVSDEDTALLSGLGGVYDLEVYHPNGDTTRIIEGKIAFKPEVTRG